MPGCINCICNPSQSPTIVFIQLVLLACCICNIPLLLALLFLLQPLGLQLLLASELIGLLVLVHGDSVTLWRYVTCHPHPPREFAPSFSVPPRASTRRFVDSP